MSTVVCEACDETVPAARFCDECDELLKDGIVPSVDEYKRDFTNRMSDAALDATHNSVTFEALRIEHDKYDRPLGGYLFASEQPEAICELYWLEVSDDANYSSRLGNGFFKDGHLIITDERVIAITPRKGDSQVFATKMADIIDSEEASKWIGGSLMIPLADGFTVQCELDAGKKLLEELTNVVESLARQHDSAKSRAAKFIQAIDDEVATASDAEVVLRNVADLFAERDELTQFDHAVANADSLDDLLVAIASSGMIRDPADSPDPDGEGEELPDVGEQASKVPLRVRASETIKNAEPQEVALYTLGATLGLGAYAISAPFSTTAGITALAAGGTATGLYASANPESVVAQISPLALAMNMNQRGRAVQQSSMAGSANLGRALGAMEYLGGQNYDTAYAQWFAEADIDSVIRAAEMAQRHAEKNPELGTPREASMLGAIGGLAHSYTDHDGDVDSLYEDIPDTLEE